MRRLICWIVEVENERYAGDDDYRVRARLLCRNGIRRQSGEAEMTANLLAAIGIGVLVLFGAFARRLCSMPPTVRD